MKLKICTITEGTKKCRSIIKKNKKNHNETAVLAKTRLSTTQFLIYKFLIDSYIIHEEFTSVNDILKEDSDMKNAIKIKYPKSINLGNI